MAEAVPSLSKLRKDVVSDPVWAVERIVRLETALREIANITSIIDLVHAPMVAQGALRVDEKGNDLD